ncbi:MAG: PQQ-binding-like beta-propeller repeat protein [Acidobacteriota bacterium]
MTICVGLLSTQAVVAQDWNQWRGAARDGVSDGTPWPDSLQVGSLDEVWRVDDLGGSYSSPVVQDGMLYTTGNGDSTSERVIALDAATGDRLWDRSWPVRFAMPESMAAHGNWPKSTPSVDGDDLFFLGIGEHLHRLDATTGEVRWSLDFPRRFGTPVPEFGSSSSPLIADDSVYVQAAGSLVAIDRQTGAVRWRALNLYASEVEVEDLETYGSPILTTLDGVEQVVVNTVMGLAGVEARSGDVLWQIPIDRGVADAPNVTPTIWSRSGTDLVLTTTESSGTPLFRITRTGQAFQAEEIWRSKVSGNMASPVVAGDFAVLPLKNGRLAYLDLENRHEAWISKPLFGAYASAVRRGDKVLLLTTDGELILLATDAEQLRVLDTRQVAGRSWAHLAAQQARVYVRSQSALVAFEWASPRRPPSGSGESTAPRP